MYFVISSIFIIICSVFILLLPLVFWMYIFTSFYTYGLSRIQFILWSFIGAVSTIPLVFHQNLFLWDILLSFFKSYELLQWGNMVLYLWIFFAILFLGLSLTYFFQREKHYFLISYARSFILYMCLVFIVTSCVYVSSQFLLYYQDGVQVSFSTAFFWTLGSIFWYYIIIWFLEEGLKFLSTIPFSGRWDYFFIFQKYLCLSACIALGFAFFENILYAYNFLYQAWDIDRGLLYLVFFRSIFTIVLHLASSIIFAIGFWYIMRGVLFHYKTWLSALWCVGLALLHHAFFDSALTYGYTWILFLYLIVMYFLLSYITVQTEW